MEAAEAAINAAKNGRTVPMAIKDCEIEDNRHAAFSYILSLAREKGLEPLYDPFAEEEATTEDSENKCTT